MQLNLVMTFCTEKTIFLIGNMQKSKTNGRRKSQAEPSTSDVKLPKLPKISMPEDFKIRTRPLFSLPEEVLKLPPPTNKAAKIQASKTGHRKRSSGK